MGRPPCCDKFGIKKGPWTPEEDIILVSYIQEHGPGNWRSVPTNTGLMRCSKSCRLRWTNYLRPGIKRGNFTDHEEKMIIHLQALLGNRWAAIASYLPQRTDNDIKNYWNTHLKKKHNKHQYDDQEGHSSSSSNSQPKGQWERRLQTDIQMAKQALSEALSLHKPTTNNNIFPLENETKPSSSNSHIHSTTTTTTATLTYHTKQPNHASPSPSSSSSSSYASSYENISKLLENWMIKSPNTPNPFTNNNNNNNMVMNTTTTTTGSSCSEGANSTTECTPDHAFNNNFTTMNNNYKTNMDQSHHHQQVPLTLLENWLFDDGSVQCHEDLMNMSLEETTAGLF